VLSFPGNRQTTKNGKFPPDRKKDEHFWETQKKKRITTIVEYRGRRRSKNQN
jgi:hypothetical protein